MKITLLLLSPVFTVYCKNYVVNEYCKKKIAHVTYVEFCILSGKIINRQRDQTHTKKTTHTVMDKIVARNGVSD